MISRKVTVLNRAGIHARPAAMIVEIAQKYECSIWFEKDNAKINAKSIMNVLVLNASYKSEFLVCAEGPDAEMAVTELVNLFDNKFHDK